MVNHTSVQVIHESVFISLSIQRSAMIFPVVFTELVLLPVSGSKFPHVTVAVLVMVERLVIHVLPIHVMTIVQVVHAKLVIHVTVSV
jgi:hypothetical protein